VSREAAAATLLRFAASVLMGIAAALACWSATGWLVRHVG
jgi:hypothetical protein